MDLPYEIIEIFFTCIITILIALPLHSQSITLSVTDTSGQSYSLVKLPIRMSDVTGLGVQSIDITLSFNQFVLNAVGANSEGAISEDWGNPFITYESGKILLNMNGDNALEGGGDLIYIFFEVIGQKNDTTKIDLNNVEINDDGLNVILKPGKFTMGNRFAFAAAKTWNAKVMQMPIRKICVEK